jgi:hypothetical protein
MSSVSVDGAHEPDLSPFFSRICLVDADGVGPDGHSRSLSPEDQQGIVQVSVNLQVLAIAEDRMRFGRIAPAVRKSLVRGPKTNQPTGQPAEQAGIPFDADGFQATRNLGVIAPINAEHTSLAWTQVAIQG